MKGPLIYYPIQEMYGADLSSTKKASELREDILEQIDLGFNVEIDFEKVRSISNGWARNFLGIILKKQGEDFIKNHMLVINMSRSIRKSMLEGVGDILV